MIRCKWFGSVALLVACFASWGACSAHGALINVVSSYVAVEAYNYGAGTFYDSEVDIQTDLDRTNTIEAIAGASRSTTTLDWRGDDEFAVLNFDMDHVRAPAYGSLAQTYENSLQFTATEITTYALSGLYRLTSGDRRIYSDVYLFNHTMGLVLFEDYNYSDTTANTANEQFVLGTAGDGDLGNYTVGSLTGTLQAGHTYGLYFHNYIGAYPAVSTGTATADGFVRLEIGDVPTNQGVVPEPASLTIFGVGSLCFALAAYRRRKQQLPA
ncbi:MAG: PEP-CTERM sorting domain-containing protein [Pirellulaceae bacterium]